MIRTICAALVCLVVGAQAQPVRKIVFLAGPKEHGAPGRHEYEKDLRELAWSLEHASNLKNIKTVVLVGRPPRDLSVFADADAIVIDGNGGWLKTETGMLFPQDNPVDSWSVRPLAARHPVLNGVAPWVYREEMYSHYFLFENPRRTELLEAVPADPKNGGWSPVSWAYDRPDGGRSFVWGGSDFHDNMHTVADYRRYLLNGIAWTAGLEIPAGGISAPPPPQL
jgi:hypothetical protein